MASAGRDVPYNKIQNGSVSLSRKAQVFLLQMSRPAMPTLEHIAQLGKLVDAALIHDQMHPIAECLGHASPEKDYLVLSYGKGGLLAAREIFLFFID